jgi:hypothetical protein
LSPGLVGSPGRPAGSHRVFPFPVFSSTRSSSGPGSTRRAGPGFKTMIKTMVRDAVDTWMDDKTAWYEAFTRLIAKIRGINSAEKFFEDIPDKMRGHQTCSALLMVMYRLNWSPERRLWWRNCLKNALPCNHMLSLYVANVQFATLVFQIYEVVVSQFHQNFKISQCWSFDQIQNLTRLATF